MRRVDLLLPLDKFVRAGYPVLGTCAGLILAAKKVLGPIQESFGWINVTVRRNAYGTQLDSFEATSDKYKYPLVFIRAPKVEEVGEGVEVLDTLNGEPILIRQNKVVVSAFHPELTESLEIHRLAFC